MSHPKKTREELARELQALQQEIKLKEGLPHIFGQKFYPWARRVWNSPSREIFVVSANQVGKSSIAIRKNIRLATEPDLWPVYWPHLQKGHKPNLFWYFYPTLPVAHTEFETKWEPHFLPRGEFKKHPLFGWEPEFEKGLISKIRFNSGVQIQFKAYSMKVKDLQSSSVYHVTFDEELPVEYLPELAARTNSTDGKILGVFTATLGQLHWKQTMEPSTPSEERHKDALKVQVSLFDSKYFDDGTPSHWTDEKIKRAISNCPTEAEVQRRIYGRFVKASGLVYEAFSLSKNMCDPSPLPKDWSIWSGTDVGSGGQSGHPAATCFVAVSPDFKQGRVFRAWRGDGIPTTASDILEKHKELRGDLTMTNQAYDHSAADFFTIACRLGEAFSPANKRREAGIVLLNTLFKTGVLKIEREDGELEKLVQELSSIGVDNNKRSGAVDDLCFAGDTKIVTEHGEIPIAQVKIGDMVLTRKGFKPVSAITEAVSHVIDLEDSTGERTWVTPGHNYITADGLVPANRLTGANCCLGLSKSERLRFSSSKASNSADTPSKSAGICAPTSSQAASFGKKASRFCTERFLSTFTEKFQTAMWCTILMATRSTTLRRILSSLLELDTPPSTCKSPSGKPPRGGHSKLRNWLRWHGTRAKPPENSIEGSRSCLGRIADIAKRCARLAGKPIRWLYKKRKHQVSARTTANQSTGEIRALMTSKKFVWFAPNLSSRTDTTAQRPVLGPARLNPGRKRKITRVFNLTVEDAHEYFANGILVANCDALRYCVMAIPWNFEGIEDSVGIDAALANEARKLPEKTESERRREWALGLDKTTEINEIEEEIDFWNDFSGASDEY